MTGRAQPFPELTPADERWLLAFAAATAAAIAWRAAHKPAGQPRTWVPTVGWIAKDLVWLLLFTDRPAWSALVAGSAAGVGWAATQGDLRRNIVGLVATAGLLLGRWGWIHVRRRRHILQMFEVARGLCRYPRGAVRQPTRFIVVRQWQQATVPGVTDVRFPARFRSESPTTRANFEAEWCGSVSSRHTWRFEWRSDRNYVRCIPLPNLPLVAPFERGEHPWHQLPLGWTYADVPGRWPAQGLLGLLRGARDRQRPAPHALAVWDVLNMPHILVGGPTGKGKSVTLRVLLAHAIASGRWCIYACDPKMVEFPWLAGFHGVARVATSLTDIHATVLEVRREMQRRQHLMAGEDSATAAVNHFLLLDDPPPPVLLVIDEVTEFLNYAKTPSPTTETENQLRAEVADALTSIARLGRAMGVHLLLATQRPDATSFPGNMKNNIDARYAAGRMDSLPSRMILDSPAARHIPDIKGRGLLRLGGQFHEVQAFLLEQRDVATVLADRVQTGAAHEGSSDNGVTAVARDGYVGARNPAPTPADFKPIDERSVQEVLAGLTATVGMELAAAQLRGVVGRLRNELRHPPRGNQAPPAPHLRLEGPPGTGKKLVATALGQLYAALDLLTTGHLVQLPVDESGATLDLDALVDRALGGVLLVDASHAALHERNGARIGSLVRRMESNVGRFAVAVAGEGTAIEELIRTEPRLGSLISRRVILRALDDDTLVRIADAMAANWGHSLSEDGREQLRRSLTHLRHALSPFEGTREVRRLLIGAVRSCESQDTQRGESVLLGWRDIEAAIQGRLAATDHGEQA